MVFAIVNKNKLNFPGTIMYIVVLQQYGFYFKHFFIMVFGFSIHTFRLTTNFI